MRIVTLGPTLAMLALTFPLQMFSQQDICEPQPTGEIVTNTTEDTTTSSAAASDFYMSLSGGSGAFNGAVVQENAPADSGTNGCYAPQANPALDPEHPKISGGYWTITNNTTYGPDVVGWTTNSVDYIKANSYLHSTTPFIDLPCGAEIHQALTITCASDPSSPPYLFIPSQDLTASIYSNYEINCRAGTCRQEIY